MISVAEAADFLGVSQRRIRQLIALGSISAEKKGNLWLMEYRDLRSFKPLGRPFPPKTAYLFAQFVENGNLESTSAKYRLNKYLQQLKDSLTENPDGEETAKLISTWLNARGKRLPMYCKNLVKLSKDSRFIAGGVSDSRAGISAPDYFEGYVSESNFDNLRWDYWIKEPDDIEPNLVLHVCEFEIKTLPLLFLISDLVQDGGPRELGAAYELTSGLCEKLA